MVRRAGRSARPEPRAGAYPIQQGVLELLQDADVDSRWLLEVNGTPQSFVDLDDPLHLEFEYARHLAACLDIATPPGEPVRGVHLGGGGASLARWVDASRPGSRQIVIDNDPELVSVVRQQLGLPPSPRVRVWIGDAREEAGRLLTGFADVVVCDLFRGGSTPAHLTSVEFFAPLVECLAPTGVLLINLADGPGLPFARRQVATVASLLGEVVIVGPPGVLTSRRFGNLVVGASRIPWDVEGLRRSLSAEPFPTRVLDAAAVRRFAADAAVIIDADARDSPPIPP